MCANNLLELALTRASLHTSILLRQALRLNYRINSNRGNLKQQGELRITAGGVGLKNWGELIRWAGLFEAPLFPKLTDQSITVEAMWKGRKEVNRKGRGWGWRIYAGKAFGASNVYPLMTAGITGATDNFKDHLFFGREQYDLLSRIIAREQGGLPIMNVLLIKQCRCDANASECDGFCPYCAERNEAH